MAQLYIVSTPIGNLDDISFRALKVLFTTPVIVAEDTRRTGNLLDYFRKQQALLTLILGTDVLLPKPRYVSLYDQIEAQRIPQIIEILQQGTDVAVVSDAGTPLVSDPGFKLVRAALKAGIKVTPIPGPTAWITGLVASGMPPSRVLCMGYLPPRQRRRIKELKQLQTAFTDLRNPPTIILYEAPHRLISTLKDLLSVAGNVDLVVAQELTKLHEKISRKSISLWIAELSKLPSVKGEYTLLFRFDGQTQKDTELDFESDDQE